MNYATLVQLIQDYVENDETSFIANIPNFVKLAEERIYRVAKLPGIQDMTTIPTVVSTATVSAPADFISPDSLEALVSGSWVHLTPKEITFLSQAYPADASTGSPLYYAMEDATTIRLAPIPSSVLTLRLRYTKKPESIVTASTSWAGDNAEEALLYGSLVEAYTYLKGEPDLLQLYEGRFREALGMAKIAGDDNTRIDEWRHQRPISR